MERLKNMPESSEGFPIKPPEKRLFHRGGKPLGTKPREVLARLEKGQTIAGGAPEEETPKEKPISELSYQEIIDRMHQLEDMYQETTRAGGKWPVERADEYAQLRNEQSSLMDKAYADRWVRDLHEAAQKLGDKIIPGEVTLQELEEARRRIITDPADMPDSRFRGYRQDFWQFRVDLLIKFLKDQEKVKKLAAEPKPITKPPPPPEELQPPPGETPPPQEKIPPPSVKPVDQMNFEEVLTRRSELSVGQKLNKKENLELVDLMIRQGLLGRRAKEQGLLKDLEDQMRIVGSQVWSSGNPREILEKLEQAQTRDMEEGLEESEFKGLRNYLWREAIRANIDALRERAAREAPLPEPEKKAPEAPPPVAVGAEVSSPPLPRVAPPEVPPPQEDRNWLKKPDDPEITNVKLRAQIEAINRKPPFQQSPEWLDGKWDLINEAIAAGEISEEEAIIYLGRLTERIRDLQEGTTRERTIAGEPAKKEKEKSPEELEEEIWAEISLRMKGPQRFEYIPDVTKDNIEDPIKRLPKEKREILTRQFEAIKALRRMTTAVGTGELRGAEFSKLMETASELKPEHLSTLMRFTRNGEAKIENGRLVLESGDELLVARPFLYYEEHAEDILSAENEADRIRLKNQGRIPQSDKELVTNEIAWLLWNFMLEAPYFDLGSDSQKRSLWDKGIKSWTKIFDLRHYCVADGKQYVGNPNMPGDRNIFDYFNQGENHAELNPSRFLKWIDTKKVLDHLWKSSSQPDWLTGQPKTTEKLEDSSEAAEALASLDFGVKGDSPFTRYYSELKKREKTADTLIALVDSFTGHGSPLAKAFALKDAYENLDPNDPKKKEENLQEIFYFLGVATEVRKAYYTSGPGADRGTPEKPRKESLMALEADVQKGFFAERYYGIYGINPVTLGTEKEFLMPGTITPEKAAQILLSFKTEDGKPLGQFLREDLLPPEKDESELTMPILVPEAAVAYYRRKGPAEKKDNAEAEFIELLKHLADPESYPQVSNPQRLQKLRAKMEKEFGSIITLGDFYEKFFRSPLKNKVGWRGTLLGLCSREQKLLEEARGILIADEWFKPKEDDERKSLFRALIGKKLVSEEVDWVLAYMLDEIDESHRIYGNKTILWPYEDGISKVERIAIRYSRDNPRLKMLTGQAKREMIIRKRNLQGLIKALVATGNLSSSDGGTLKARLDQDIDFMLYEGIRRKSAKNMFDKNPGLLLELFR